MKLEILLQFIVPLMFLAIWALTSLLNRDAQPLPPRPGRGPGPGLGGSRAGSLTAARSELTAGAARYQAGGRPLATGQERPATGARWTAAGPPGQGRPGGPDDGILILESNARGPSSSTSTTGTGPSGTANARSQRGTSSRRAARGRSTGTGGSLKPIEAERPRALTGLVTQSLAQKKARKLEITPLSTPLAPIGSAPLTQMSAPAGVGTEPPGVAATTTASSATNPMMTTAELRGLLTSSNRRRELVVLAELLQPPLALRPGRRLR